MGGVEGKRGFTTTVILPAANGAGGRGVRSQRSDHYGEYPYGGIDVAHHPISITSSDEAA